MVNYSTSLDLHLITSSRNCRNPHYSYLVGLEWMRMIEAVKEQLERLRQDLEVLMELVLTWGWLGWV